MDTARSPSEKQEGVGPWREEFPFFERIITAESPKAGFRNKPWTVTDNPCRVQWPESRYQPSMPQKSLALRFGPAALAAGIALVAARAAEPPDASKTPAWTAPPRAARKANPVAADPKILAEGKELYTAACLPCHGPAGKGDGTAASALERDGKPIKPGNLTNPALWDQPDGALFWKISEGNSPMPAFQEAYNETQRWTLVNYVRTLAPAKPATPKPATPEAAKPSAK